jgi:hypothetical protein
MISFLKTMGHRQNAEVFLFGSYSCTSFQRRSEWLSCGIQEEFLRKLGWNERQTQAVMYVKKRNYSALIRKKEKSSIS